MMSRPPDNTRAGITTHYDKERGVVIEGKIVWEWIDKNDQESSSNSEEQRGTTSSEPIDSSCRDFERDRHSVNINLKS
jgi:hypothetical protein